MPLPAGRALHVFGTNWGTTTLTLYYAADPWPAVLATAPILPAVGDDQVVIDLTAVDEDRVARHHG